ncbi:hypothetical protein IEQ34_014487 [Dendrobium chrysotoxum]|uniref:Uncharacterized protein n=1 Tax=Dendrobium chrysotoxum TaxID=161865 RepID=A0AAV7GK43_DENCH|nr:hypothetical protein IEQ34_014487 [Dendrobium chrysotoxum]
MVLSISLIDYSPSDLQRLSTTVFLTSVACQLWSFRPPSLTTDLPTSIARQCAMEEWFVAPIMEKLINTGFQYLGDQVRWQTGMKEELERLRENHPKIQAIVDFASSQ